MPSPPARTHRICAPQLVPPESKVLPGTVSHTAWLHVESPQLSQYDGGGGGGGDGDGDGAPGSTLEVVVQLRKIGVEHPLAPSPLPHGCE